MKKFLFISFIILIAVPIITMPALAFEMTNVKIGGQVRLRGYNLQNFWDFNDKDDVDNWSVFRLKTSLSVSADTGDNTTFFVKLTNQNYGEGVTTAKLKTEEDNLSDKFFVDNAYIDMKKFLGMPINVKFGRQNLTYGTGFVLFDGQSQVGSTSIYFDGVKATWEITEKSVLDALYFKDQENHRNNGADDDITLAGAYFTTHCPVMGGQQEVYALNKKDDGVKKDIWMYGLRLSDKFDFGLDYSGEIAYQTGESNEDLDIDQKALGYKLDVGYKLKNTPATPRFFIEYVSLEGDDASTADEYEEWDVFYGGWPQFGDLLAWKYLNVGSANSISDYNADYGATYSTPAEAVYSNINMATIGISADLFKDFSTTISYSMLTIDETDGNKDDDFGDYYQLTAKYNYSKYLSFAVYGAIIEPGDAFTNDDRASEMFWETNLSF